MKKDLAVIAVIVFFALSGAASAQMDEKAPGMKDDKAMGMGMGMGKEMMGKKMKMMAMMGMGPGMMNKPSMMALGDGIVILAGNKLYKYDANLNLVKEAEIKMDAPGMMGQGMPGEEAGENQAPGADADEHSAHHPQQ